MAIIKFVNEKKEIQVPDGSNLRKEALRAGVGLYPGINKVFNCHGFGSCGSCRVLITKGMENWTTVKEELYNNITGNVLETAQPLARGKQAAAAGRTLAATPLSADARWEMGMWRSAQMAGDSPRFWTAG